MPSSIALKFNWLFAEGLFLVPVMLIEIFLESFFDFSIIEENKIQCDPERNGTLHCAHSEKGMEYLIERFDQGEQFEEPIALIDKSMPLVALNPWSKVFEKTLSNLEEVKARRGKIILCLQDMAPG